MGPVGLGHPPYIYAVLTFARLSITSRRSKKLHPKFWLRRCASLCKSYILTGSTVRCILVSVVGCWLARPETGDLTNARSDGKMVVLVRTCKTRSSSLTTEYNRPLRARPVCNSYILTTDARSSRMVLLAGNSAGHIGR